MNIERPIWSIHGLSRRGNPVAIMIRADDYAQACAMARGPQHRMARLTSVAMVDENPEASRAKAIAAFKELK